jgi:TRAP-type C4-dicarboxylate transport system permease small subunit
MSSTASSTTAAPRQGGFHRFWRALKQLLLEVAGAMFAFLGIVLLNAALRSWTRDVSHWLIASAVAVAFALLFFFFALSSFRRARKL